MTRTLQLRVDAAKHPMWKATKHHRKTRPIKHNPYQRRRKPRVREPEPPPPPQVVVLSEAPVDEGRVIFQDPDAPVEEIDGKMAKVYSDEGGKKVYSYTGDDGMWVLEERDAAGNKKVIDRGFDWAYDTTPYWKDDY